MIKNQRQKNQKFFSYASFTRNRKENTFFPKNRKADIPVTILVIGVLAICTLAILSFFLSDRIVKNDFVVLEAVEEAKIMKEKISFYANAGFSEEEIKNIIEIKEDAQGKFIQIKQTDLKIRYNLP